MEFERRIEFEPAYDKRPKYGIHGVNMRWILIGPKGAIQFLVFTNWQLPNVRAEEDAKFGKHPAYQTTLMFRPIPADLGYHSPIPLYEGQELMQDYCQVIGKPCYYDGSGLNATPVFELLVEKGHEACWKRLEQEYLVRFEQDKEAEALAYG